MRPVLDVLPEPMLLLQRDGVLLHANRAAARWLRQAAPALAGQALQALVATDPATVAALMRQGWRSASFSPARLRWRRGTAAWRTVDARWHAWVPATRTRPASCCACCPAPRPAAASWP